MADSQDPTSPAPGAAEPPTSRASNTRRDLWALSRSSLPYLIAALLASALMAWYFFIFVPGKLDYFVGLRFRTLAIAAGHTKSKVENLAKALDSAIEISVGVPSLNVDSYLKLVVPDVQLVATPEPPAQKSPQAARWLYLQPTGLRGRNARIAWPDVMAVVAQASRRDFDDLLLADGEGNVVWQREQTTPRIGNLSELLGAADTGASRAFGWNVGRTSAVPADVKHLISTAVIKLVTVGGTTSALLVQAIALLPPDSTVLPLEQRRLYVAGMVPYDTLQQQAMRVPAAWLVLFAVPVMLLFLALPFIKLATLTARERFSFADIVLAAFAAIAAAGLGAILPLVSRTTGAAADGTLARFATQLEHNVAGETREVLALGDRLQMLSKGPHVRKDEKQPLLPCSEATAPKDSAPSGQCLLWEKLGAAEPLELDVVIWFDREGNQLRKWTTKAQVTGNTSHKPFEHYRALMQDDLWSLSASIDASASDVSRRFVIDPLRAPTTSELGVMFALPLPAGSGDIVSASEAGHVAGEAAFFGLNVRPASLVDPVVPPGYGFAVIAPDGKVLFHSDEGLSLEENFFAEVGDPDSVRARARARRVADWSGDYHGRPHRFHLQPVTVFTNCPWLIVTFVDLDAALAMEVLEQSGTVRLGALNLLCAAVVALLFWMRAKWRHLRVRDLVLATAEPDATWVWVLVALAEAGVVAIVATSERAAHLWVDRLLAVFILLPALALVVVWMARRRQWRHVPSGDHRAATAPERLATAVAQLDRRIRSRDRAAGWAGQAEAVLLVLLVGGLPAIGYARLVHIVEDSKGTERWLEGVERRWSERQAVVRARVNGPNNTPGTRKLLVASLTDGNQTPDATRRFSYLGILEGVRNSPDAKSDGVFLTSPAEGQEVLRWLLGWNPFFSADGPGQVLVRQSQVTHALTLQTAGGPAATVVDTASRRPVAWWAAILGPAILVCTLVIVCWARLKLLPAAVAAAPPLDATLGAVPDRGNEVVLLIGPPLIGKDGEARGAVARRSGAVPIARIDLLHTEIDRDFIEEQAERVEEAISDADTRRGPRPPFWIHLSNLETQLVTRAGRSQILHLIEKLLEPRNPPRALIVTTSVDPIAHFQELFAEERSGIYTDAIPEVELSHSALLLSRFRRCYLPMPADDAWPWPYDQADWKDALTHELGGFPSLAGLQDDLLRAWGGRTVVPFGEYMAAVRAKADPCYELIWASCTRNEKLVLVQLAEEGFVTTHSQPIVAALVARGLVNERPAPAIFNRSFADFLRDIEGSDVIQEWERMEGTGLWVVAGRLIGTSLVAGGLFFLLTQDFSVQALLPIASGTGLFSAPFVRTLIARMGAKPQDATPA